jgi:NTP pyrophosphohydrolases including oxidative damage repair enzymes
MMVLSRELVQRALADPEPLAPEELLIMRDQEGRSLRPLHPPEGVQPRESAVLLLLIPHENEYLIPLTVRSSRLAHHSGEVSLPGGACDPDDCSFEATALRECNEELGIPSSLVEIWGGLNPVYIAPSNFRLHPIIGFTPTMPELYPNVDEVEEVLLTPLSLLLDPHTVRVEQWERRGMLMQVPFYAIQGYTVWGATAFVLSQLVARIRRAISS